MSIMFTRIYDKVCKTMILQIIIFYTNTIRDEQLFRRFSDNQIIMKISVYLKYYEIVIIFNNILSFL